MPDPAFTVLAPPRHACLSCGRCCHGVYIELDEDEQRRVTEYAAELGVSEPIREGGLRFEKGSCVFLGEDWLCNIHRKWGAEAKPHTCQQFPFTAIEDGDVHRAGIDPACQTAYKTWITGPEAVPAQIHARHRALHPSQLAPERALIGALAPGATVAGLLGLLCTGRPTDTLDPALAERILVRLKAADLAGFVARDDTGAGVRLGLQHLPAAIERLERAPEFSLSAEQDAWAVEVARRMVFLRLAPLLPSVQAVALLTLIGAVACYWADPAEDRFGPAISAWSRGIRWRTLWQGIAPDPETLSWLATGR